MKYTIKKGKHWPQWWWLRWFVFWDWPLLYGDVMKAVVRFDSGGLQIASTEQWNKLVGFSIGLNPKKHSARFVFDFDLFDDVILSYYTHQNFKHDGAERRLESEKKEIRYNTNHKLEIRKSQLRDGNCFLLFKIDGYPIKTLKTDIPYSKWGWKLYPYIGGRVPAERDTTIELTTG